jgi:hypothetical protein
MSSSLAPVLLGALALGLGVIGWLATSSLARRRGLTFLAAALDPRSWLGEPVLGLSARALMAVWAVAMLVAWVAVGRG